MQISGSVLVGIDRAEFPVLTAEMSSYPRGGVYVLYMEAGVVVSGEWSVAIEGGAATLVKPIPEIGITGLVVGLDDVLSHCGG